MKKTTNSSPYQFEGRIPLSQAIPLGLQHVMAMFIGNLTPLIIVMGACGLTADAGFAELRTALLQNAMIIAGIVTLVQMFSIGPVGGKVPIVMGTSSGFLGVLNNTVAACGGGVIAYGAIMGACWRIAAGRLGFPLPGGTPWPSWAAPAASTYPRPQRRCWQRKNRFQRNKIFCSVENIGSYPTNL